MNIMNIETRFQTQAEPDAGVPLISVVVPVHNESAEYQAADRRHRRGAGGGEA